MKNKVLVVVAGAVLVLLVSCALAIYFLAPWGSRVGAASTTASPGEVRTESRDVRDFGAVEFASAGELSISQGDTEGLTIQAEENILRQIRTEVKDGKLTIRAEPGSVELMKTSKGIYYTLTVKRLDSLDLSGVGSVRATNIKSDRLSVALSGAGTLDLSGETDHQSVIVSGAGSYAAGNLKSRTGQVSVTGLGSATVWTTEALDAAITSVGSVNYYGSPEVKKAVKGLGSVNSLGAK